MAEWVYLLAVFVALTFGYVSGFVAGSWRSDRAPTPSVWENVRRYSIDMNKECALREMELNHEEQMALIERGIYDPLKDEEKDEEDGSD